MSRPKITVPGTPATIRAQRQKQRAYDRNPEKYERRQQQREERRQREQHERRMQERREYERYQEQKQAEESDDLPF